MSMTLVELEAPLGARHGPPAAAPPRRYKRAPVPVVFPTEERVPESTWHYKIRTLLYQLLEHAYAPHALLGSDQFVYWDASDPKQKLSPDVMIRLDTPNSEYNSWKVWERGAPHLAVEITSDADSSDLSVDAKVARYRKLGVGELVVFDGRFEDPEIRVWDRVDGDLVERDLGGEPVAECATLGLWWVVRRVEGLGLVLRLARDRDGNDLLPTPVEARERELRDAEQRIRELEAELARRQK